jgi:TolB-like protein/class 3 adenylate cyclase/Flp pilus assembly protein TadD
MVQERPVRVERKLSAILAADVAGYSRLMHHDEEATHAKLTAFLADAVAPAIAEHGGRIVKNTGDGFLAEFPSAVEAVRAALQFQNHVHELTIDDLEDRRIAFRVGINVGDVIVEPHDIFGDGVNIAARLESIAEPGGICVSSSAYDHVRGKVGVEFVDLGEQNLKNIALPVRTYAVARDGRSPATQIAGIEPDSLSPPRLSIVVLPFINMNGDPAHEYLSDVITDQLTASLSRIRGAFVIARSTAFTYKGKAVDVRQIGRDLGVRYVLEGSEQHGDNRVRVIARLINAQTGGHVWADKLDVDRTDLLDAQDEIVTRVARALDVEMPVIEAARIARTRSGNLEAEELAMRCRAGFLASTPGSAEQDAVYSLCERALLLDERNVDALSILAFKYAVRPANLLSADPQADVRQAQELVSRVLAIEPGNYRAHSAKFWILIAKGRPDEALVEAEKVLDLNPSAIPSYQGMCIANLLMGRPEKTLEYVNRAIRLSPRDPSLWSLYFPKGIAYSMLQNGAQAIEWYRRVVAMAPQYPLAQLFLAAELALSGAEPDAREMLLRYLSLKGARARTITQFEMVRNAFFHHPVTAERFAEGLRKAGMPEE